MRSARASGSENPASLSMRGDVRLVLGADVAHVLAVGEVIFAIRQLQAALQQVGDVCSESIEARRHPQSKKIRRMKIGVVQRVHVGAKGFAEGARQFALVMNRSDGIEMRPQRREALRFDCRPRPCRSCIGRRSCALAWNQRGALALGGLLDQRRGTLVAQIAELEKTPMPPRSGGISVRAIQSPLAY